MLYSLCFMNLRNSLASVSKISSFTGSLSFFFKTVILTPPIYIIDRCLWLSFRGRLWFLYYRLTRVFLWHRLVACIVKRSWYFYNQSRGGTMRCFFRCLLTSPSIEDGYWFWSFFYQNAYILLLYFFHRTLSLPRSSSFVLI